MRSTQLEDQTMRPQTRRSAAWMIAVAVGAISGGLAFCQENTGAQPSVTQASSITVPPASTPVISEGNTGIAAKYPGDIGIEKDPDVIFVESFEGSVDEICSRWEGVGGKTIMSKSDDIVPGSPGKQSLLLTRVAGGTAGYMDGGNLYR